METQLSKKLEYKWVIMALCFLMVMICLGFCSSNKGIYLSAITEALNIPRSEFALNDTCRYLATTVVNLFFSALIFRFGEKKMILGGFGALIISMLIYANADSVLLFCVGGCFLGIGVSWTTTTMVGYVVGKWCKEHKGKIMGLVLAANGIGGAVAAQIISPIIYDPENPFGYRNAYYLTAVILAVVGVLMLIFFRNAPGERTKDSAPKKKARGAGWSGITFEEAVRKPWFYLAAICIFFTGMSLQSLVGINAAHMKGTGLDPAFVANVLSIHSLSLALFKFLTGFSFDSFGLKKTMLICNFAAVTAIFLLIFASPSGAGKVCATAYGAVSAIAMPLETIMIPLIVSDMFGEKSFAKILGLYVSFSTAGFAISSPVANLVYDKCGSYIPILYVLVGIMIVVAIAFQFILISAGKTKKEILTCEQ